MPKIVIDGKEFLAKDGETIIQVCDRNGIYIPRFCYHPALSIAGNCRMCLVEIEKMPKLQIACATEVKDGMIIYTQSEKVKKARKDVLEFLLINHPLDCPICDQVGECYLQDYYMKYGLRKSRMRLEDKNTKMKRRDIGRYLILDNERCVLCTRCVRFCDEITKTNELFVNSRGDHSFIDIKPSTSIENNYSLNLADICPVGAITSKDFRFKKRVYRLITTHSICLGCATGCKIKVQHYQGKIYRIVPDPNIYTNTWICDKGRLSYKLVDSPQRLTKGLINGVEYHLKDLLLKVSDLIAKKIDEKVKFQVILSDKLSIEDNYLLYYFAKNLLKTDEIYVPSEREMKIEDGILLNTYKAPNLKALLEMKIKFNLKDITDLKKPEFLIGFYDDVKNIDFSRENSLIFSYTSDTIFPNLIAIKTYFETKGSFINYQGFLRRTDVSVDNYKDTAVLWEFLVKVLRLFSVYPDFEEFKDFEKIINTFTYNKE